MVNQYKQILQDKMDVFVQEVFDVAHLFPREEVYITTSQLKRAALSIILNYIEGYARIKKGTQLQFLEIAYGSLKETKYLLYFSNKRNYISVDLYNKLIKQIDEIGAMLYTEIKSLSKALE